MAGEILLFLILLLFILKIVEFFAKIEREMLSGSLDLITSDYVNNYCSLTDKFENKIWIYAERGRNIIKFNDEVIYMNGEYESWVSLKIKKHIYRTIHDYIKQESKLKKDEAFIRSKKIEERLK